MAEARATDLSPRETPGASTSAVKAMQAEGRYPEARERYADLGLPAPAAGIPDCVPLSA